MIPYSQLRISKTPKSKQRSGMSKLKRMKQRLQYKKPSTSAGTSTQGVLVDDPARSEPLSADKPLGSTPSGGDDSVEEKEINTETEHEETKEKNNNFNCSAPMKVVRVCKGMSRPQRELISVSNLGAIIGMKCSKLQPELCRFLMECFDPDTCRLDFGERGSIPVTVGSVVRVMGVANGPIEVQYHVDIDATSMVLNMLGIEGKLHPTLSFVEGQLGPSQPADPAYLRKFLMFLVSSLFAPTTGIQVSPKCYPMLINDKSIPKLNLARFIIDILIQTAKAKGKKNWFKACMPYLMLLYVDALETSAVKVPSNKPSCMVWSNKMISTVVGLDTKSDGSFGNLPLKACYRKKIHLFSPDTKVVDMFIKEHALVPVAGEKLQKYRVAVTNMFSVFEDGIADLIRTMSSAEVNTSNLKLNEEVIPRRKRQKRTRADATSLQDKVEEIEQQDQIDESEQLRQQTSRQATGQTLLNVTKTKKRKACDSKRFVVQNVQEDAVTKDPEHGQQQEDEKKSNACESESVVVENPPEYVVAEVPEQEEKRNDCVHMEDDKEQEEAASGIPQDISEPVGQLPPEINGTDASTCPVDRSRGSPKTCCPTDVVESEKVGSLSSEITVSKLEKSSNTVAKNLLIKSVDPVCPSPRRPVTRSMSPMKVAVGPRASPRLKQLTLSGNVPKDVTPSPIRLTRFAASKLKEAQKESIDAQLRTPTDQPQENQGTVAYSNSMNRKLDLEFGSTECNNENEEHKRRQELIDDCPSFDLGVEVNKIGEATNEEVKQGEGTVAEEPVVISSNEGSGDSLDKIFSSIEMPSAKSLDNQEIVAPKQDSPKSCTPLPQKRRVVKMGLQQKSPFVVDGKKLTASKSETELYNKVISYGISVKDEKNEERLVDYGDYFVLLGDVADSVRPGAWLSNSTCEAALIALGKELAHQKKFIMPLRIATKLRKTTCFLEKSVQKAFDCTSTYRLDHKDMIMFSVLQDLTPELKTMCGHYYLIVLNLKDERFEIMDSMRSEGNKSLMKDARAIIGSIKYMWAEKYKESKIDISKYPTVHIHTPLQTTTFDCGFFLLKFIESWTGRNLLPFKSSDMPALRKQFLKKWVDNKDNLANWRELLFSS